jgi:hypothetical protein
MEGLVGEQRYGWGMGAHLLDDALLVDTRREFVEVDRLLDGVSETGDQLDVDICFDKGVADLLDHGLKGLFIQSGRPGQVVDGGIDAAAEILQNHPG